MITDMPTFGVTSGGNGAEMITPTVSRSGSISTISATWNTNAKCFIWFWNNYSYTHVSLFSTDNTATHNWDAHSSGNWMKNAYSVGGFAFTEQTQKGVTFTTSLDINPADCTIIPLPEIPDGYTFT